MTEILPNEIILKIIDFIPKESRTDSLRHLRLVSKRLDVLISPILFQTCLVIVDIYPDVEICRDIVSALATSTTTVFENVRRAEVKMVSAAESAEERLLWLDLLDLLTPAIKNVHSLTWVYYSSDFPPQRVAKLITSLSSLRSLRELSITLGGPHVIQFLSEFSLEPLSNLHKFSAIWEATKRPGSELLSRISRPLARCPGLESFSFSIARTFVPTPHIAFEEIFAHSPSLPIDVPLRIKQLKLHTLIVTKQDFQNHLRHFRHLQRLKIKNDPSPSSAAEIGAICALLQHENIFLKDIRIDAIHPPQVFNYLLSCTDMESICLIPRHRLDNSPHLIDQFFSAVLPHHSHSLKALKIGGNLSAWPQVLKMEQLEEIQRCQSLRDLCYSMSLTSADAARRNSIALLTWLKLATRLPRLRRFKCSPVLIKKLIVYGTSEVYESYDEDPDPPVLQFVAEVVEEFIRVHKVDFHIYYWRRLQ